MNRFIIPALLFALLLLQACDQAPETQEAPARPVKTTTVNESAIGKQWTFSGTAEDALETDLSFRVGGKIIAFPGDQIGRKFAEGDVIARLDPADYELELRQARANLEQVRANYVRSKADMERNEQLFERGVISRGELDQIEADFKSYDAQLKASSKQLDIARKHLSYTVLHAPFDGWIGSVDANVHQNVSSGQAVVSFNAGRQMKMIIAVPDLLITQVHEGDSVDVIFDALPGRTFQGKVMEVGVNSKQGSSYPVKVYLDNEEKLLRSGMSGHVNFTNHTDKNACYYIPAIAVTGNPNGVRSVWVVDKKTSTVTSRQVTVGQLTAMGLEIVDGLKPGEEIVIRGVSRLKEGLKVRLMKNGSEG